MLELRHVSVCYGSRMVLDDISLAFPPGRILGIIGPNGSGKSTLLKTALGLLPPCSGEILLDGSPLVSFQPRQIAQKIAYLPQSRPVPDITVLRMVFHARFPYRSYPRHLLPEDFRIVEEALAEVDALSLAGRTMKQLSGGERQKVYQAMVLAQKTDTVLMDEPTTFLDVSHQFQTASLAERLSGQGKAVVLVLHDLPMAFHTAGELAVLHGGRIVSSGTPDDVFSDGTIPKCFGVSLRRMDTGSGWQYYCVPEEA